MRAWYKNDYRFGETFYRFSLAFHHMLQCVWYHMVCIRIACKPAKPSKTHTLQGRFTSRITHSRLEIIAEFILIKEICRSSAACGMSPTFSKWYVKKQTVIAASLFYYVKVMKYGMGNKRETLNKYTALQLQFSNIKYRLYPSIQIISKRWLVWRQLLSIQSFHSFDSSPSSTFFIHNPWALNLLAIPNY